MNAKQVAGNEALFVRIPTALKLRLQASARTRGASTAREVQRLLEERLAQEVERGRHPARDALLATYKGQLDALTALILGLDPGDAARELRKLRKLLLDMRSERELKAREWQHRRDRELAELEAVTSTRASPLISVIQPGANQPAQHPLPERRRHNLVAQLAKSPRGTKSKLSSALGCTRGRVSQLLSEPFAKGHRTISDDVARIMERTMGLKSGALDKPAMHRLPVQLQKAVTELLAIGHTLKSK